MNPIDFPEANFTLGPPDGMDDCDSLRVQRTGRSFVSQWQPDELERAALARGGVVQLEVLGSGHPPVAVGVALPSREAIDARSLSALRTHLQQLDEMLDMCRNPPKWTEADREQMRRELAKPDRCNWPGCDEQGYAEAEEFGSLALCLAHYGIARGDRPVAPEHAGLPGETPPDFKAAYLAAWDSFMAFVASLQAIEAVSPGATVAGSRWNVVEIEPANGVARVRPGRVMTFSARIVLPPAAPEPVRLCPEHGLGIEPGKGISCPRCIAEVDAEFERVLKSKILGVDWGTAPSYAVEIERDASGRILSSRRLDPEEEAPDEDALDAMIDRGDWTAYQKATGGAPPEVKFDKLDSMRPIGMARKGT